MFIIPMGIGMFLYRDLLTDIMLGSQWGEVKEFIGIWGAVCSMAILWANYPSVVYVAKGRPKLSLVVQIIQISVLVPALYVSSGYGFRALYISRTLVCVLCIFVHFIVCKFFTNISPLEMFVNTVPFWISAVSMSVVAMALKTFSMGIVWQFFSIFISAIVYFSVLLMFPKIRCEIFELEKVKELKKYLCAKRWKI